MFTPAFASGSGGPILLSRNTTDTTDTTSTDTGSPKKREVAIIVGILIAALLIWIALGVSFIRHLRQKRPVQDTVGGVPISWPGRHSTMDKTDGVGLAPDIEAPVRATAVPDGQPVQMRQDPNAASAQPPTWIPALSAPALTISIAPNSTQRSDPLPEGLPPDYDDATRPTHP
ncbi:hypothetical protein FRB96_003265 [Tulasnella sp. 330]|nr:hypothetical protein FRB96_003265 [Tulasnella sp. 330]KAG8878201.1 hypothetical protein FRB97_002706 [Tulasnella sp. 331]KAG8883946.1 hypothetical protein FRB98_002726 [Tulasnella sp. 332]